MRVTGPAQVQKASKTNARRTTGGDSSFSGQVAQSEDTSAASSTVALQASSPIDAVLFAQAADPDDRQQNRQQALNAAKATLDALEQVRRGLLLGAIPVGRLQTIARNLTRSRARTLDPQLSEVMDDILLRARVELAKAGIYSC